MIRWFGDRAKAMILARARKAVAVACEYTAEKARDYAPVDSGDLRESIAVVPVAAGFAVYVGVDYALPVHFGHLAGGTWVPPNPFLWRAIEDARARWPRLVREVALTSGFSREATINDAGALVGVSSGAGDLTATFIA